MTTNNSIEAAAKLLEVLNEYAEITDELWLNGELESLENYNTMFFTRRTCEAYLQGEEIIDLTFVDEEFNKLDKLSESKYAELYPKELWRKLYKATQEIMSLVL